MLANKVLARACYYRGVSCDLAKSARRENDRPEPQNLQNFSSAVRELENYYRDDLWTERLRGITAIGCGVVTPGILPPSLYMLARPSGHGLIK